MLKYITGNCHKGNMLSIKCLNRLHQLKEQIHWDSAAFETFNWDSYVRSLDCGGATCLRCCSDRSRLSVLHV